MEVHPLVFVWVAIIGAWSWGAALAGIAASAKGHDPRHAFWVGFVLSPVVGLLYAAALPDRGGARTSEGAAPVAGPHADLDAQLAILEERGYIRKEPEAPRDQVGPHVHRSDGFGGCSLCGKRIG